MVLRFTADKPGAYTGTVALTDMHEGKITAERNRLTSTGSLEGYKYKEGSAKRESPAKPYAIALQYEAQVRVLNDGGTLEVADGKIAFKGANSLTILLDAGTDFVQDRSKGWRGEHPHRADHRPAGCGGEDALSKACSRPTWRITRSCSTA